MISMGLFPSPDFSKNFQIWGTLTPNVCSVEVSTLPQSYHRFPRANLFIVTSGTMGVFSHKVFLSDAFC